MGKFFFLGNKYARTQIDTPYKNLSTDELLSRFKSEEWSRYTQYERINTFQELENRYAVEQKRPVARIEAESSSLNYGSYNNGTNVIRINLNDSDINNSYEQLDSYYHESRHAYQYQAVETGRGLDQHTRNMCNVEFTAHNYVNEGPDYDIQTCEMDSNNTAATRMLEHSDRYKDDPKYQKYLARRQEHFESVNNQCEARREYIYLKQDQMSTDSLSCHAITNKQREQIKDHIGNKDPDPVIEESREIEARIHRQNQSQQKGNSEEVAEQNNETDQKSDIYAESHNEVESNRQYESLDSHEKHASFFEGENDSSLNEHQRASTENEEKSEPSHERHADFFEQESNSSNTRHLSESQSMTSAESSEKHSDFFEGRESSSSGSSKGQSSSQSNSSGGSGESHSSGSSGESHSSGGSGESHSSGGSGESSSQGQSR